jgi:NitT/TauT family transport system permease protein
MHAPRRFRSLPTAWTRGAAGVLIAFVVVELLTRAEFVNPAYVPPASSVVAEAFGLLADDEFWDALTATLWAAGYGLARAILIAVPLGLLLGLSRWAYRAAITVVELLRPIPSVALIPLAILLYGTSTSMKAFLVTYACLWPILFNTIYGVHDVERVGVDTARVFGLGRFKRAARVNLPAASPFIYTGIKIAASVALILAIGAEIVAGGSSGLGIEMGEARALGNLQLSYAYVTITGIIGLVLYIVMEAIERRLFRWRSV